jgi:hypothetical protein
MKNFQVTVDFKSGQYLPERLTFDFFDEADSRESFMDEKDKWASHGALIQLWKILRTPLETSGFVSIS